MLIALVGLPCAGKKTIADYLCVHHAFKLVKLRRGTTQQDAESVDTFDSPAALLEYATSHWRSQLVTVDLNTLPDLQIGFDKRPWFLLVSVEAPLTVRWARAKE